MRLFLPLCLLFFTSCGLKTGLVVYDDSAAAPTIAQSSFAVENDIFHLQLRIKGGGGVVFYQIDRTELADDCKCIGNWLRYYESSASAQRKDLTRSITLRKAEVTYAFRLRVVDSLGRKSAWSKIMKAKVGSTHE